MPVVVGVVGAVVLCVNACACAMHDVDHQLGFHVDEWDDDVQTYV